MSQLIYRRKLKNIRDLEKISRYNNRTQAKGCKKKIVHLSILVNDRIQKEKQIFKCDGIQI